MLVSTFYEPSIECNAVTPWLQGTIAALESLSNQTHTKSLACVWSGHLRLRSYGLVCLSWTSTRP